MDGNLLFVTSQTPGDNQPIFAPVTLPAPQALTLSSWRAIVSRTTGWSAWANYEYSLRIWSTIEKAIEDPAFPDVEDYYDIPLTSGPTVIGISGDVPGFGPQPTWEIIFDISNLNFQMAAGQSLAMAIIVHTFSASTEGVIGVLESIESGPSDIQVGPLWSGGWRFVSSSPFSQYDGRYAVDIRGTGVKTQ